METVIHGVTGTRFAPKTKAALVDAMQRFENAEWDQRRIRENAARYSEYQFQTDLGALIAERLGVGARNGQKFTAAKEID